MTHDHRTETEIADRLSGRFDDMNARAARARAFGHLTWALAISAAMLAGFLAGYLASKGLANAAHEAVNAQEWRG
jgi:anti-sigma factor RsiW